MNKEILKFEKEFNQAMVRAEKETMKVVSSSIEELCERIVNDTPVGDQEVGQMFEEGYTPGNLKGNWQISFGSPASNEIDRKDPSGSTVKAEVKSLMNSFRLGTDVYFSNSAHYAYKVEYLGTSKKAQRGMMRLNALIFPEIIKKNTKGPK